MNNYNNVCFPGEMGERSVFQNSSVDFVYCLQFDSALVSKLYELIDSKVWKGTLMYYSPASPPQNSYKVSIIHVS